RTQAVAPVALADQADAGEVRLKGEIRRRLYGREGKDDVEGEAVPGPLEAIVDEGEAPAQRQRGRLTDLDVGGGSAHELDERVERERQLVELRVGVLRWGVEGNGPKEPRSPVHHEDQGGPRC